MRHEQPPGLRTYRFDAPPSPTSLPAVPSPLLPLPAAPARAAEPPLPAAPLSPVVPASPGAPASSLPVPASLLVAPASPVAEHLLCMQPTAGSQLSVVQVLPSSQSSGVPPPHLPSVHVWPCKHLLPVSHFAVSASFSFWHLPVATSQPSLVHGFMSLQFGPLVGMHTPAAQWSPVEQSLPSLQVLESLSLCSQPVAGLHESSVHGF